MQPPWRRCRHRRRGGNGGAEGRRRDRRVRSGVAGGCVPRSAPARAASSARLRTQTVFGVGDRCAELLVIGEAPGADEDRQGEPFVGRAGQLLNSMLRAIGSPREKVYIANVLKCRPPGNRDPKPTEVASCLPYLQRQVELIAPRLMLAVGRIAAQNLLATDTPTGAPARPGAPIRHARDAADRDLPSGLPAAQSGREAQGLDRPEIRACRTRPAPVRPRARCAAAAHCLVRSPEVIESAYGGRTTRRDRDARTRYPQHAGGGYRAGAAHRARLLRVSLDRGDLSRLSAGRLHLPRRRDRRGRGRLRDPERRGRRGASAQSVRRRAPIAAAASAGGC